MKGRGKVAYIPEEARGWEIDLENSEVEWSWRPKGLLPEPKGEEEGEAERQGTV
jgi:hypothetical protein